MVATQSFVKLLVNMFVKIIDSIYSCNALHISNIDTSHCDLRNKNSWFHRENTTSTIFFTYCSLLHLTNHHIDCQDHTLDPVEHNDLVADIGRGHTLCNLKHKCTEGQCQVLLSSLSFIILPKISYMIKQLKCKHHELKIIQNEITDIYLYKVWRNKSLSLHVHLIGSVNPLIPKLCLSEKCKPYVYMLIHAH